MALFPPPLPLSTGLESQSDCITEKAFQRQEHVSISKGTDKKGFSQIHACKRGGKTHPCVLLHAK